MKAPAPTTEGGAAPFTRCELEVKQSSTLGQLRGSSPAFMQAGTKRRGPALGGGAGA